MKKEMRIREEKSLNTKTKEGDKKKMKNKVIALFEIVIVLCSVFLVALPAIAAASANTITTASEDDYVLDIYGNANEDDTIDMRDLTYVKLIFFGKRPETELADAKYDGEINPLDFIQIKLIIVGKEKEITVIDSVKRAKTFKLPITRIIALDDGNGEPLRVLEVEDLVVGVGSGLSEYDIILPEISSLPVVDGGGWPVAMDYEKVLSIEPDLFFTYAAWPLEGLEGHLEPYGVQVLRLDIHKPDEIAGDMIKLGYLLGKRDKAEEFVNFHEGYMDKIKSRTDGLSEDEKPRVFIEYYSDVYHYTSGKGTKADEICTLAGVANIAHDKGSYYFEFDPEWVLEENPDIVVRPTFGSEWGYAADETQKQEWETEMEAAREETMSRPGWEKIIAVENGDVYIVSGDIAQSGLQGFIAITYMAKWSHSDLFEDLDPEAIHQEYVDRFLRIDYDVKKYGAFVYPPLEGS